MKGACKHAGAPVRVSRLEHPHAAALAAASAGRKTRKCKSIAQAEDRLRTPLARERLDGWTLCHLPSAMRVRAACRMDLIDLLDAPDVERLSMGYVRSSETTEGGSKSLGSTELSWATNFFA